MKSAALSILAAVTAATGLASCEKGPTPTSPAAASTPAPGAPKPVSPSPSTPAIPAETTMDGTLKSGFSGIGGEHTGWVIQPADDKQKPQETDISAVADAAKSLDGKKVHATGTLVDKKYVERGLVKIFKVSKLEPAT